jgi:hypothetical protein
VVLEIWFKKSGSRNLVQEIWFKKSGSRKMVLQTFFFSGSIKVVDQKKRWVYTIIINPHFIQVGEKWFCKLGFFYWFEKSG